ncbi:murein DD-endopeptidase [Orbus hercynius]|uniref:Murein DD-endopeptidase n=1 Tax=Orbus hercynius TaxID=593135 RepID=A0A495RBB2_9GAMM|nr:murein DD-endopeptidase MepM [Orbus hercynius]RKS84540.1 murein DD-endopeptidase [Orbus hercynius]
MQHTESSNTASNRTKVPYITVFGVLILIIVFFVLWRPLNLDRTTYIPLTQQVQTTVIEREPLPAVVGNAAIEIVDDNTANEPKLTESSDQPEDDIVQDEIDKVIAQEDNSVQYTVGRGDTLYGIMMQYGVNRSDIYLLTEQYKQLANLRIGQVISWTTDSDHNLNSFTWIISNNNVRIYERVGDKFTERTETREGVWEPFSVSGEIDSNFIADAKNLGLTSNEIATITKALQWQLDFRRLKKGDKFSVLLSREMLDNIHENSQLLAVRIRNGSKDYYAVLAEDGHYYDMNGGSLSQSFLRYPLVKQARISSAFNPRRLNPVTKKITPHNGVDFAVSRGTPVLSVGDGEVVIAKYSGSAGNFIAIRHGRQYTTKYMHLDKILVRAGQQIKKGDQIGLSGNTGRSTGPHLHYELHIDGKPVNPLTASLPVSDGLTGKSKTTFLEQFKDIKTKLAFATEKASLVSTTP